MTTDEAILEQVTRIAQVVELALKPQLQTVGAELRKDKTDAAIFDLTARKWVAAGDLQTKVQAKTGTKPRATKNHVAALISAGLLEKKGNGPRVEYRSAGLI
jgi:hypothetical protein